MLGLIVERFVQTNIICTAKYLGLRSISLDNTTPYFDHHVCDRKLSQNTSAVAHAQARAYMESFLLKSSRHLDLEVFPNSGP